MYSTDGILFDCVTLSGWTSRALYRLGPGDVLAINVWGFDELEQKELIIRPDGKIAFPLVGELAAAGLTPEELAETLTKGLSLYIKEPLVTVNVAKFRTTRVYVLGEVTKPGMYGIDREHRLLDAIGAAGGYTKYAAKRKVSIIRQNNIDQPIRVNLLDLLTKGDISQNHVLQEGDVVYLTKNNRIDFAKDILPWISAAYQIHEIREN